MAKLVHSFALKFDSPKRPTKKSEYKSIGKCLAIVIKENGEFKARITSSPVEECSEFQVVPFTPKSLELKGKVCVFLKNKDKYNHNICLMRDRYNSIYHPGIPEQYDVLKEHLLLSGNLVRKDDILYFDYKKLVAFREKGAHLDELLVDSNQ